MSFKIAMRALVASANPPGPKFDVTSFGSARNQFLRHAHCQPFRQHRRPDRANPAARKAAHADVHRVSKLVSHQDDPLIRVPLDGDRSQNLSALRGGKCVFVKPAHIHEQSDIHRRFWAQKS